MKEIKYYGVHACQAVWEKRREDIIRVYLEDTNLKAFGPLLKWCAQNKKAYHIIPREELAKVTDSIHHEGICILAKDVSWLSVEEFLKAVDAMPPQACVLYLDGVQNPHNLGSILRTAAHFGVRYILGDSLPALSPSACRIAKGGAELVRLVFVPKPLKLLELLRQKGFVCLSTSSRGKTSLHKFSFPKRVVLGIGSESKGMSSAFLEYSKSSLYIPGTAEIESLNVAVATGLCISEYCRQMTANP